MKTDTRYIDLACCLSCFWPSQTLLLFIVFWMSVCASTGRSQIFYGKTQVLTKDLQLMQGLIHISFLSNGAHLEFKFTYNVLVNYLSYASFPIS